MTSYNKFENFNITFPRPFIVHVEVNRSSKMNAWIEPMWHALKEIFDQLSEDPQVRAVIMSGAGDKAFTAGLDVHEASTDGITTRSLESDPARRAIYIRRHVLEFQSCLTAIEKCEKRKYLAAGFQHRVSLWLIMAYSGYHRHAWHYSWLGH
jgi:delta(3,5)-delta(2,4)-dienoyl-CoA isomerase